MHVSAWLEVAAAKVAKHSHIPVALGVGFQFVHGRDILQDDQMLRPCPIVAAS